MARTFPFRLITPTGVLFEGEVEAVTATNPIGEFGVLPQHVDYITSLIPCVLTIALGGGRYEHFVISGGLAEVRGGAMTVLAPASELAAHLANNELSKALRAAEERMKQVSFYEPGYNNAERQLQLARARVRAAELFSSEARS